MLDDPTAPVIYRASGAGPYPTANNPQIPSSIFPRPVTLRDRVTVATLVPFFSPSQVPARLLSYLCDQLNKEIEGGDTYPMINPLPYESFGPYWFGNFAAVMLLGDIGGIESVQAMENEGCEWGKICLGSFYVKPNYPGRSSHVCNGGFLVTPAARNKGVGKSMGECYLDWAPQLVSFGTYSVKVAQLSSCLSLGLHLFCLQPRVRDQLGLDSDMGFSWLQADCSSASVWQPKVIYRLGGCHHLWARPWARRRGFCV